MGAVMLSVIQFCHGNQQQGRRTCMVSILSFIIVILIISILCFLSGRRMAENRAEKKQNTENPTKGSRAAQSIKHFLMRHPVMVKGLLLFYIAFAGCFTFPIRSQPYPLDFTKAYLLICSYGIIGLGFAGLYGEAKERTVYPLTLLMTILGMVCRYVLEYGEASNVYNFTMLNILSYIILIPAFTVGAYHYIVKYLISAR